MGGFGSGRRVGKDVTTSYRRLDVRALQRAGFLRPGHVGVWGWHLRDELRASIQTEAGEGILRLRYASSHKGLSKSHDYVIRIARTGCHFGGDRPWFLCPCCGLRVAILYGGEVFACRSCYDLAYPVQRESDSDRLIRRAEAIRARLGWGAGIANPRGCKPKGMHWKTYKRLCAGHEHVVGAALDGAVSKLDRLIGKIASSRT